MPLWNPDVTTVANTEFIGRRLFPSKGLIGAKDQKRLEKTFEITHFLEKRDREISVDRLGEKSVDGKVKKYLNLRGHYAASQMHKAEFQGWAVVRAKVLQSSPHFYQVSPSPMPGENGKPETENNYHAYIESPERLTPLEMAAILKHIFEKDYRFEASVPVGRKQGFLHRVRERVCDLLFGSASPS